MEVGKSYCCFFSPTATVVIILMCLLLHNSHTVIASSSSAATGELGPTMMTSAAAEEGVYDIDYRGPETHSAVFPPPAGHFQGRPFLHRRRTGVESRSPVAVSGQPLNSGTSP